MSESQSRFWWLLVPPAREPTPPPESPPNESNQESSRFWPWTAQPKVPEAPETPKEEATESSSFWSLVFGPTNTAPTEQKLTESAEAPEPSTWWSMWPFSRPADSESDNEDSESAELFRQAKSVVETARDSCHYAIKREYNTHDVELAVAGTKTQNLPVKYNYRKRPLLANEVAENTLRRSSVAHDHDQDQSPSDKESKIKDLNDKTPKDKTVKKDDAEDTKDPNKDSNTIAASSPDPPVKETTVTEADAPKKPKLLPNILPEIDANLRTITVTTRLRLVGEAFLHGSGTSEKHLYMSTDSHIAAKRRKRTKKIIVIAVHSFLPSKFVKSLVGLSTGSAEILGRKALAAVARWMDQENCHADISIIALDGTGPIGLRVEHSMRLLRNWVADINSADFVYVVANSIGSPVAITLVSHMLQTPQFDGLKGKKIGLLSLGGALCGPYSNTDTKVVIRAHTPAENTVIGEILELQRPRSDVSVELVLCLSHLCTCNVKIALAGSTADPLIPLSSATASNFRHPNIFRCMHVDGDGVPNFIVRLLSMALTMSNIGYTDHSLVRDLSDRLQGPIGSYGVYNENDIYDVGLRFALETTSLVYRGTAQYSIITEPDKNLYSLPWNFRGLVHDLVQAKHIGAAELLLQMVEEYVTWEPVRGWRELHLCFAALEDSTMDELLL